MRTVGIKLADGSFYPIMEEGSAQTKKLELTTANDNQTCVMVDLYRSKTCSMEDAEYIDTLKIENLNAHQNGEPSISFDVGLDENGELSASIADPETGATSNSQLTLVSRTAEERLVADDYSISGDEPALEDSVAEEPVAEDEPVVVEDSFDEETAVEEPVVEEPVAEEAPADDDSGNGAAVAAGVVAGAGLLAAAGIMAANKNKDDGDDAISDEISADETISEDPALDESFSEAPAADETISDDTLPDMDFDLGGDTTQVSDSNGLVADDFDLPDDTDATQTSDDFDLPDDTDATQASDDFDLPDDTDATQVSDDFDLPDDTDATQVSESNGFAADDFDIPGDEATLEDDTFAAPAELTDNSEEDTDDFFNDMDSEPTPSPAEGLNFSGLYDKETEMGESATHNDEDIQKKTRAPVIICVICAIICIIATLLVLLVVPGKFNLRQKHADKKAQTAVEAQAEKPAPVEEKKPDPVPQAKENEVVVIEKAEEVKPVPPPAAETKSKNVTYKIKWGDTLWDIADTYYKNPWRYKKIASYNGIKNPDHIISGTVITIPAE